MNGLMVLLAASTLGVDYGWQSDADGQLEYIIQIEPALLAALQNGEELVSQIHPDVQGVRRFRIRVGTGVLPRTETTLDEHNRTTSPWDPSRGGGFRVSDSSSLPHPPTGPDDDGPNGGAETENISDWPTFDRPGDITPRETELDESSTSSDGAFQPIPHSDAHVSDDPAANNRASQPQPEPLNPEPVGDPQFVRRADYEEETTKAPIKPILSSGNSQLGETPQAIAPAESGGPSSSKPWLPLVLTSLLLFASVGLNIYLGWIGWSVYRRYCELMNETQPATISG